jgi:uncharacterized membrane protein
VSPRWNVLLGLLGFCFPELAFMSLRAGLPARWAALALVLLVILRWGGLLRQKLPLPAVAGILAVVVVVILRWSDQALRFYPVLMNLVMLGLFAGSLWRPPPMIERLARLRHPDLDERGVRYTRTVTQVWCGFFVLNGSVATLIAFWGSTAQWAFYNGFLAYVLMGLLFAGEWLVRRRVMAQAQA